MPGTDPADLGCDFDGQSRLPTVSPHSSLPLLAVTSISPRDGQGLLRAVLSPARDHRRAGQVYSTFALTDEAYALTASETARSWPSRRILWLQAFLHAYWVTGATAGAVLGMAVHLRLAGLDFAMTALFAVLAIDAFRARRDIPTPVLALACALVARLIVPSQMLLAAFALFTAGLLARHAYRRTGTAHA